VRVKTEPGRCTTFLMTMPAALALVECLILQSAEQFYAIETSRVAGYRVLNREEFDEGKSVDTFEWEGDRLPVMCLRSLLAQSVASDSEKQGEVIICETNHSAQTRFGAMDRFALIVDKIHGKQETLLRSLGRHAARWPGISGATELSDGNVAL